MEPSNTTVKRVSSGVWALEQEIVRCFLIVGQQRALLLDTGAEACDLMGMIREITPLPLVVLNTHGDGDHTANNNQFRDIHAHPDEFATIRRFRPDLTSTLHPITALSAFDLGDRVLHVIEPRAIPRQHLSAGFGRTGFCSPAIPCPTGRYFWAEIIGISTPTGKRWSSS